MLAHNQPTLGVEEQQAAARVLGSGWVAQGPEVAAFEDELCAYLGLESGHAVAVSSGTAALYLALWALDSRDKRVGLPAYACAALRNAVAMVQGHPVYLDCAEGSPNVDLDAAARAGLDVLIAPSMYGIPIAPDLNRPYRLIEDLAQSLGAAVGGNKLSLRGDVGICSFYATKLMTSGGQGGAVVSRDKTLIDAVRDYRQFDCRHDQKLRFNFQMTDLQAAVGRVQLARLPEFLTRRSHLFGIYADAGLDLLGKNLPPDLTPVRYRAILNTARPPAVIEALARQEIRAILPIEEWELLGEPGACPNAMQLTASTVSLPLYPALEDEDAAKIAACIRELE